ncbi:hypothetical protein [Brachyspira innocens]|uniref:hypothetical protein n=1 Tax=Brachyspira innocens TaxID=13264 RepID=UPI0003785257|nr:hypothetical protein [Brachyspira innocens]
MKKAVIKIILCLTAVIFAVSCGGNNDSPTNPTQGEFSVNIDSYGTREEKTIGTSSEDTSFTKEGKIKCYPGQETKVEINKVTAASGSVSLEPADFELTTSTVSATANEIGIKLSASGIEKIRKAAAGEVYQYTFTFLFTRTSDNKTATSEGTLYVANIDIIKQTDIETAIKNTKYTSADAGTGVLVVSENPVWKFNLSGFNLNQTSGFTATATSSSGSVYVSSAESAIFSQAKGTGFFFSAKGVKDTSNKQATFTITVKLNNSGYMLDSAISYVATDGFKLILSLGQTDGTWR